MGKLTEVCFTTTVIKCSVIGMHTYIKQNEELKSNHHCVEPHIALSTFEQRLFLRLRPRCSL